jgi:adenine-specific DNA methylase
MIEKSSSIKKKAGMVAITTVLNNNFLNDDPEEIFKNASYVSGGILNNKWMKVLLKEEELFILEKAKAHNDVFLFSDIASVDVGIVTGVNRFFLVTDEVVKKYHLEKYAYPMFGRSQHCPGVIYSEEIHRRNKANDLPTNFLLFDDTPFEELPESIKEYICLGEDEGYHKRYKCRIRKPWYKVPSVYSTEIGMLKRSHHFPKLILNTAGAFTTDTAYRIRITKKDISAERIVFSFVNSLTALSAELEGRHYGGGVLELVPSEIEKLLIPIPKNVDTDILSLDKKIQTSDDPYKILVEQDRKILSGVGLSEEEQNIIHSAWRRIKYRRHRLVDSKK